ncbi:hypothetical protein [Clostridium sp. HCS.1]
MIKDKNDYYSKNKTIVSKTIKKVLSFGSCLAMIISYTACQSIP